MKLIDIVVGTTGTALLLAIAGVMLRRRLWREYPFFFAYVVFNAVSAVFLLLVISRYKVFFFSYWMIEVISAILVLLALHEAFYDVFRAFYIFWWFRIIFPVVAVAISLVSIWHAVLNPLPRVPMLMTVAFAFDNSTAYLKAAVFLVFLFLVVALHVRWRRYPYDVALGFAVSSIGMMISYAVFTTLGTRYILIARNAPPVAYVLACTIWFWSFAARFEPEPRAQWKYDITPEQLLEQVKNYLAIVKKPPQEQE